MFEMLLGMVMMGAPAPTSPKLTWTVEELVKHLRSKGLKFEVVPSKRKTGEGGIYLIWEKTRDRKAEGFDQIPEQDFGRLWGDQPAVYISRFRSEQEAGKEVGRRTIWMAYFWYYGRFFICGSFTEVDKIRVILGSPSYHKKRERAPGRERD